MIGLICMPLVQNIWHISTCSVCLGPPASNSSSSSGNTSVRSELRHSEESILMIGMSWCFTVLFVVICRSGVLAPEAGGVLPAELSEDLFSTEHRRLRSPKLLGPGSDVFDTWRVASVVLFCFGVSLSDCGSGADFAGESDSCNLMKGSRRHKERSETESY